MVIQKMPSLNDIESNVDADPAYPDALSEQLNRLLEEAHTHAATEFEKGARKNGITPLWHYVKTFFHSGIVQRGFLKGSCGLINCSVAAQDAYNRSAMIYCMAVQEK